MCRKSTRARIRQSTRPPDAWGEGGVTSRRQCRHGGFGSSELLTAPRRGAGPPLPPVLVGNKRSAWWACGRGLAVAGFSSLCLVRVGQSLGKRRGTVRHQAPGNFRAVSGPRVWWSSISCVSAGVGVGNISQGPNQSCTRCHVKKAITYLEMKGTVSIGIIPLEKQNVVIFGR